MFNSNIRMGIRLCYSNTMSLPQRQYYHFTLRDLLNSLVYHNIIIVCFVNFSYCHLHCHLPTDEIYLDKQHIFVFITTIISRDSHCFMCIINALQIYPHGLIGLAFKNHLSTTNQKLSFLKCLIMI